MTPEEAWARLVGPRRSALARDPTSDRVARERAPTFQRVGAGPVNDTWKVTAGQEAWLLRVSRPLARDLGLDLRGELAILDVVARAGLGPEPVAADPEAGLLLTSWLPGTALTPRQLADPAVRRQALALLARVHGLPLAGPALDHAGALRRYGQLAAGRRPGSRDLFQAWEAEGLAHLAPLERQPTAVCHHDPVAANFVRDGSRWALVDWEFAGRGPPAFDLAVMAVHLDLDRPERGALLADYQAARGPGTVGDATLEAWVGYYHCLLRLWNQACPGPATANSVAYE